MKDMFGKDVIVGDVLVYDNQEVAYFYDVKEDGTPKIFAIWAAGSLSLFDIEKQLEKLKSKLPHHQFIIKMTQRYEDLMKKKLNELMLLNKQMKPFIEELKMNGYVSLSGTLEHPYAIELVE